MVEAVSNGDFSAGFDDWTVTQNGNSLIRVDSRTGDAVSFSAGNTSVGGSISQTVSVIGGRDSNFSLDFGKIGRSATDAEVTVTITYVDENGITQTLASGSGSDSFGPRFGLRSAASLDQTLSLDFTVPEGVAELTVTITDTTSNTASTDLYLDNVSLDVMCFAAGTQILTPTGDVDVAHLRVGDSVLTAQNQLKNIAWIGHSSFGAAELEQNEKILPVRISSGALGPEIPKRDLVVSRQHRMLVSSKIAQRMFGEDEVLVPAIDLIALPGVEIDTSVRNIRYFHVMLEDHDVIVANGAFAESFYLGPQAIRSLSEEALRELHKIFPNLSATAVAPQMARAVPPPKRRKRLMQRHAANKQPIISN